MPLGWWLVLGAALAPTDAVVVNSLLRDVPVPDGLRALISGESLFNDGAGVVMFLVTLGIVGGGTGLYGHGQVLEALAWAGLGGAIVGGATGWLSGSVIRLVRDDGVRLVVTLALVLGSYRLALLTHVSGPIAVVTAGLVLTRKVPGFASGATSGLVGGFWAMLDELLDTLLFLLLGLQTLSLSTGRAEILLAAASIPIALASRLVSVALPVSLNERPFRLRPRGIALLTWGGMRGGVSVALALTMPHTRFQPALLFICYVVVVSSILLQGLTMPGISARLFRPAHPEEGSRPV
jgi:CPA1 family monovalent cation:H+ antiporter